MKYWKGHGTENDFVLVPDLDGRLELSDALVARICDRRAGIGADGVLRVVRSACTPEGRTHDAEFFLDHRNADGSRPEMCGNGVRLYVRYLLQAGLVPPGPVRVATRGGVKELRTDGDDVVVDMGIAVVGDPVLVDGAPAVSVDMGNPHAVLAVPDLAALGVLGPDRTDLNVEYVEERGPAHVAMRVHERGVGETRSCGTGACAAVVAHSLWVGVPRGTPVAVDVPGGRVVVTWLESGRVLLAGPAVLVSTGELCADWLTA